MTSLLTTIALATSLMSVDSETTYRMTADSIVVTAETATSADEVTTTIDASSEEAHKVYEEAIEQEKAENNGSIVDARSPKARSIYQEAVKQNGSVTKNRNIIVGGAKHIYRMNSNAPKNIS